MYKRGDIVVVPFPFADSKRTRKRPALVISNNKVNKSGDYIMVQITSKEKNDNLSLELSSIDFIETPLPLRSYVRCHKVFLLNESLILYKITSIKEHFMNKLIKTIHSFIE